MKHALFAAAGAFALTLAACENQPDEALPPEGELEGALPADDATADDATGEEALGGEPEIETVGKPQGDTMESGANPPGTTEPPAGSKLQKADPDS
ncbi:MAG: hypothetical protein GVX90_05680 [Alphaproteobacteria bacterium]|jgi:hypothetical protein|nr:hypothetical protein [Alphaproteobacteria bacterium]